MPNESRVPFRESRFAVDEVVAICLGTRGVDSEGEFRAEDGFDDEPSFVLVLSLSSLSTTPNSEIPLGAGEGSAEAAVVFTFTLMRRPTAPALFNNGEGTVDVRLEIRGILVGVSLDKPKD